MWYVEFIDILNNEITQKHIREKLFKKTLAIKSSQAYAKIRKYNQSIDQPIYINIYIYIRKREWEKEIDRNRCGSVWWITEVRKYTMQHKDFDSRSQIRSQRIEFKLYLNLKSRLDLYKIYIMNQGSTFARDTTENNTYLAPHQWWTHKHHTN